MVASSGQGRSLSLVKGEASGLIPCAVSGPPGPDLESGASGAVGTRGRRPGVPVRAAGRRAPRRDLWPQPAPGARRVSPLEPNSRVEDPTRPGEEARAGGGAESRRDLPGPGLALRSRLCPPCPLVPAAFVALAPRPWSSWRVGTHLGCAGRTSARRRVVTGPVPARGWRAWLSRAGPLRVLAAPGPGAPWLSDLEPGNWRLKDSVTASRAGSRGRRMPGAPFTERLVEARGFRSPPRRAVRGDGWRWLGCPRLGKKEARL